MIDHAPGFDLLQALRQLREAEGKPPPDEPATLRELAQPGDTPKIAAYLNGETQLAMAAHFAAELDTHSREAYAWLLAAVACHGRTALAEIQSTLLAELLNTLQLPDIRTSLLTQVREMAVEDLHECRRIVVEHGLEYNLFCDALMLCRTGAPLNAGQIQLIAELGATFNLNMETVTGLPILTGYLLGLHERSEYTLPDIANLKAWLPLLLKKMNNKDISKGEIKGYYIINKDIGTLDDSIKKISITDAFLLFDGGSLRFYNSPQIETIIKNTAIAGLNPNPHFWPLFSQLSFRGCEKIVREIFQSGTRHIKIEAISRNHTE